jgi:hypothetical protein
MLPLASLAFALTDTSPVESFLKQLPTVAKSPLAFVAYCLVVAAWVVSLWLSGQPERKTIEILNTFKGDDARLQALTRLTGKEPPQGLTGNKAILAWVASSNRNRTKTLYLVGWAITLVAVIVFVIAWRATPPVPDHEIQITFQRVGTINDCPDIGTKAKLSVLVAGKVIATPAISGNCHASLSVSTADKRDVTLALSDAAGYILANPAQTYSLADSEWAPLLSSSDHARLSIFLFDYASSCPQNLDTAAKFQAMLGLRAHAIRGMFKPLDHRYDYLGSLKPVLAHQRFDYSSAQEAQYAVNNASLQVLTGICSPEGQYATMRSEVFAADLHGELPEPLVTKFVVKPENFGDTRDIHTASILYTLAEEGLARSIDRDIVEQILGQAKEKASQIQDPAAVQITEAVDRRLRQLEVGKPKVLPE